MLRSAPAVPKRSALDAALGLLARRDHSALELRRKLQRAGHTADAIDTALLAMREQGYLNEARFATALTRSLTDRGRGPRAISAKLSRAGVKAAPVDEDDPPVETDWLAMAGAALQRRYGEEPPEDAAEWGKRARWLLGRGFTETQIRKAMGAQPPAPATDRNDAKNQARGGFKRSGLRSRQPVFLAQRFRAEAIFYLGAISAGVAQRAQPPACNSHSAWIDRDRLCAPAGCPNSAWAAFACSGHAGHAAVWLTTLQRPSWTP